MERLLNVLNYQKQLLEFLDYKICLKNNEIPLFTKINISRDDNKVGGFIIEQRNLYYLDKDGYMIGNISKHTRYSREKEKNLHTMCHITINDDENYFNCYNGIKNSNSDCNIINNYVLIKNDNIEMCKYLKDGIYTYSIKYDDNDSKFSFIDSNFVIQINAKLDDYDVHFRVDNINKNTYFELIYNDQYIKQTGALEDILLNNKELLDRIGKIINLKTGYDLLNNSFRYMNFEKTNKKVYKPE